MSGTAALRPELARIVERLAGSGAGCVGLDALADALGTLPVTSDEIGALIDELERRGVDVGGPTVPASALLGRVLHAARELRAELGRTPSPAEIAGKAGLSPEQVRLGLFFARMLGR